MNGIFKWNYTISKNTFVKFDKSLCPYCRYDIITSYYTRKNDDQNYGDQYYLFVFCPLCGWMGYKFVWEPFYGDDTHLMFSTFNKFEINNENIAISYIISHFKKNFSDIYMISPRRFEEVVARIFSEIGFRTMLTKETRDGGVDVFLYDDTSGELKGIVECKKNRKDRSVGIGTVQRLAGSAIQWEAKQAYLVTTSQFSQPAIQSARKISNHSNVDMDLWEATDVFNAMKAFQHNNFSLVNLSDKLRGNIIYNNSLWFNSIRKENNFPEVFEKKITLSSYCDLSFDEQDDLFEHIF
jgi:hypothetical protein